MQVSVVLDAFVFYFIQVFDGLLRACPETKKALISWLVECFKRNENRAKVQ